MACGSLTSGHRWRQWWRQKFLAVSAQSHRHTTKHLFLLISDLCMNWCSLFDCPLAAPTTGKDGRKKTRLPCFVLRQTDGCDRFFFLRTKLKRCNHAVKNCKYYYEYLERWDADELNRSPIKNRFSMVFVEILFNSEKRGNTLKWIGPVMEHTERWIS